MAFVIWCLRYPRHSCIVLSQFLPSAALLQGADTCRTIVLGITRRGLLREMTNLNIDAELDGPSEHVRHIQYHKDLVEPAVREFLQRCLEDSAGMCALLVFVPVPVGS